MGCNETHGEFRKLMTQSKSSLKLQCGDTEHESEYAVNSNSLPSKVLLCLAALDTHSLIACISKIRLTFFKDNCRLPFADIFNPAYPSSITAPAEPRYDKNH